MMTRLLSQTSTLSIVWFSGRGGAGSYSCAKRKIFWENARRPVLPLWTTWVSVCFFLHMIVMVMNMVMSQYMLDQYSHYEPHESVYVIQILEMNVLGTLGQSAFLCWAKNFISEHILSWRNKNILLKFWHWV